MTVEVVMSWRDHGCEHRRRNLAWTLRQWSVTGWPVRTFGADDGHIWCRANDVTPLVETSTADTIVVADADCFTQGIYDAVAAVEAGAAWAVPHLKVFRLTPEATERVLAGEAPEDQTEFAERPYKGNASGTLFVIRRDVYLATPLDRRFVEWGQEDDAANLAWSLLLGAPWRGKAPLFHLWHPPQSRRSRGIGNDHNLALYRRYKAARNNPERMRALVEEGKAVSV